MRKIFRLDSVREATGLPKSSLYALMKRGEFPASVDLPGRRVGWDSRAVENWVKARVSVRTDSARKP